MSTSDQNEGAPLTRKQLRELRLTGSTPVITEEEAAAAVPAPPSASEPAPAPAPEVPADLGETPMTRRQAREQERVRTASVPVIAPIEEPVFAQPEPVVAAEPVAESADETPVADEEAPAESAPVESAPVESAPVESAPVESESESAGFAPQPATAQTAPVLSEVPVFPRDAQPDGDVAARPDAASTQAALAAMFGPSDGFPAVADEDEDEGIDDPVSSAVFEAPRAAAAVVPEEPHVPSAEPASEPEAEVAAREASEDGAAQLDPSFGRGVSAPAAEVPTFSPSFDDIVVGDSTGSHHAANALIFTQGPTEGSLSGPVASTGELLITGTYELPRGIGSQGHAIGAADGKEVDAVLIDGELPPTSSPTPIAASAAVSTSKPAGEVIRPPAPEKGNKLMLTLAIVAGGLALALAAALVAVFITNVLGR